MGVKFSGSEGAREWFHAYTRDLSPEDLHRLFTHDTRDAYEFFTRGAAEDALAALPWWKLHSFPTRRSSDLDRKSVV